MHGICKQMDCLLQQARVFASGKPRSSTMRCSAKCCCSQKPPASDRPGPDMSAVALMHINIH